MGMIERLDAVADLVKGSHAVDPAYSQPFDFEADVIYLWEEARLHRSIGTGEVREEFEIVAVLPVESSEAAEAQRSRVITEALDAWVTAGLDAIRVAQGQPWEHAIGSSDADFLRQLDVRGALIRVSGYKVLD